jgi:hypothetical protein
MMKVPIARMLTGTDGPEACTSGPPLADSGFQPKSLDLTLALAAGSL